MAKHEQSMTIVMRARDEASQTIGGMGEQIKKLGATPLGGLIGGFFAVQTVAKAAAAGVMGFVAANDQAAAASKQSAAEILEAQIKINTAWGELAGAIPMVGEAAKKAVDAWSNADAIRKQIEAVKQLTAETEKYGAAVIKAERDAAKAKAQARGDSASEIAKLTAGFATEDRQTQMSDLDALIDKLKKERMAAFTQIAQLKQQEMSSLGQVAGAIGLDRSAAIDTQQAAIAGIQTELDKALDARARLAKANQDLDTADQQRIEAARAADANAANDKAAAEADARRDAMRQELADRQAMARQLRDLELEGLTGTSGKSREDLAMDREIEASKRKYDAMREQARNYAVSEQEREAYLTQIAAAATADRARIEDDYRRKQADADKADAERRRQSAEAEKARLTALADTKAALTDSILTAAGKTQEVELRRIKREAARLREEYANDDQMLKLIDAAEKAKLAQAQRPTGPVKTDTDAFTSRFLTRSPESVVPKHIQTQLAQDSKRNAVLDKILDAIDRGDRIVVTQGGLN